MTLMQAIEVYFMRVNMRRITSIILLIEMLVFLVSPLIVEATAKEEVYVIGKWKHKAEGKGATLWIMGDTAGGNYTFTYNEKGLITKRV